MKTKNIKFETKNTQTFLNNNQKVKKLKNKRKYNELLINDKNSKELEEDKHFKFNSLRNSFGNIINIKQSKLFNTELENKNNFWSMRNNYSVNIGIKNIKNNNKNISISPQMNNKKNMLNRVMEMCHNIYESKNIDNNNRMKLRENIIHKINHYVNDNLNKNILCPESKDTKKKKIKINFLNTIKKEKKKLKSIDSNKITLKSFIQKFNEMPNLKPAYIKKSRIFTFENYANKNIIYNHPQIYTLNNNIKKLYPLKTHKNLQTFVGFSQLIPERKINQKEINKQIYSVYKTMKNRNEIAFHI